MKSSLFATLVVSMVLAFAHSANAEDAMTTKSDLGSTVTTAQGGDTGSEADCWRWHHRPYYYHYHYYYYTPAPVVYYYPVTTWRPRVVIFDGVDGAQANTTDSIK